MAIRVFPGLRIFKDNGEVATDATISFYDAGTTTPRVVYGDSALTVPLALAVPCSSTGWVPDIWTSESVALKAVIAGTGVSTRTIDPLTIAAAASTSAGASLAFKNALYNADFGNWATTSYSNISGDGSGVETAKLWFFAQNTAAANAISRQAADHLQSRYGLRLGRPATSSVTNKLRLYQTLAAQDAIRLRSQRVTLSFYAKAGANFSGANLSVLVATGTGTGEAGNLVEAGGWTGQANPISVSQTVTTTSTRYSFSATLGSSINELAVQLAYTPTGTAGADDWVQIEDVQLEIASAASTFAAIPEPFDFLESYLQAAAFARTYLAAQTAGATRTALGLAIGTDVQAWAANLDTLGGYNATQLARLTADVGLSTAANKLSYWTADGVAALTDLTATGRAIAGAADKAAARAATDSSYATQAEMESGTASRVVTPDVAIYSPSAAKAFVNFDGTAASPGTGRISLNISSVTKAATSDYTVNYTSAFSSANYVAAGIAGRGSGDDNAGLQIKYNTAPSASAMRILCGGYNALPDHDNLYVHLMFMGDRP